METKKEDFIKQLTEMSIDEIREFLAQKSKPPKPRVLMYIVENNKK